MIAFQHDRQHPTRSSFKVPEGLNKPFETITVQTDRLDEILPRALPIHFIKLAVEGVEYQVIQGAVATLRAHKPLIIFEHTQLAQQCYAVSPAMMYELVTHECSLHIL